MSIKNCPDCGKIFNYNEIRMVCPECWEKNEEDFRAIREYLYENPNKNISEVAEATGISIEKIKKYLREDRLIAVNNASASLLDCQKCGKPISSGNYCEDCRKQIEIELRRASSSYKDTGSSKGVRMHTRHTHGRR